MNMLSSFIGVGAIAASTLFIFIVLNRKYSLRTTLLCYTALLAVLTGLRLIPETWLSNDAILTYSNIFFLILHCLLFHGTPFQKIFVFSGSFCVISVCISCSYFLAFKIWPDTLEYQDIAFVAMFLASIAVALRVLIVVNRTARQKMPRRITGLRWLHYAFGLFNSFVLAKILLRSVQTDMEIVITDPLFYPLFLLQIIWCFSIMYHAFVIIQEKAQVALELKLVQRGLQADKIYYERMTAILNDVRTMRHDLKYHISTMRNLMKQNKVEEAERYIADIEEAIQSYKVPVFTANQPINALLMDYHRRCEGNGITFSVGVDLPGTLASVSNIDLCIIIGNLLENALEAVQRVPEDQRKVELKAFCKGQSLFISTANAFDGKVLEQNGQVISRKENGGGIGSQSIRTIACKYQGEYLTQWRGTEFSASVILQVSKEDVAQIPLPERKKVAGIAI